MIDRRRAFNSTLPASSKPMKRTKLNGRGKRGHAKAKALRELREDAYATTDGRCPICGAIAEHLHHKLPASQGGKDEIENLLPVCGICHRQIHENPEWSYSRGYLLKADKAICQYIKSWATEHTETPTHAPVVSETERQGFGVAVMENADEESDDFAGDLSIIPVEARRVTADQLEVLDIESDTPHDDVATALVKVGAMMAMAKAVKAGIDAKITKWIEANGRVTIMPGVFYDRVETKTVKCVNVGRTVQSLLEHTGGDLEAVNGCLSSNAMKHGACRKVLPADVFETLFTTTTKAALKPSDDAKKLQRIDLRFIPQKGGVSTSTE